MNATFWGMNMSVPDYDFTKKELLEAIANDPVRLPPSPIEMGQWFVVECSKYIAFGYEQISRYLYFKERAGSMVLMRRLP